MSRGKYRLAACRGINPDKFFEFGAGRNNKKKVQEAKNICNHCPVEAECLRDNMGAQYGIFGGTTPLERWRLIGMPGHPGMISITYPMYNLLFERSIEGAKYRRKIKKRIQDKLRDNRPKLLCAASNRSSPRHRFAL